MIPRKFSAPFAAAVAPHVLAVFLLCILALLLRRPFVFSLEQAEELDDNDKLIQTVQSLPKAVHKEFILLQIYLQGSFLLFRFGGRPTGFGIEFEVPAVKKSARNCLAGARTDRCAQSRNGFAAT